ncbi:MAG: EpsG family protein [Clostridia bacterium]|nr:EpsG family protein [Clostridia bacterium]
MAVYYLTALSVFVFSALALYSNYVATETGQLIKNNHVTKLFLLTITLILVSISGFRYYVGTDFGAYYRFADSYSKDWLSTLKNLDEPGFPILTAIITPFTTDGAVFIFITSAFTVASILAITFKYTDTYLFSTLLFLFVGIWHGSFNGVRQFFAAAIICLGHRFIFDKKLLKYMLCVFIAFLFHKSAIIMIVPYFILRGKINLKNIAILIGFSILLLYNYELIFSFIGGLKEEEIIIQEGSYYLRQVNILRVLVSMMPAIFCFFVYTKSEKTPEQTFYLNWLILYGLFAIIGMNSPYISRINIYLMILLPLALGKLVVFKNKNFEIFVKAGILIFFFFYWRYEISNSSALYNFRFIWNR